ncbi:MAG TPA: right-handed parallel beta-helix repeat-containing protein [Mucilaginibacter sp.]|nr:right-handed parallel beta-helix repeat-containing protein [Mucilaginibacter sp.]
MNKLFLLIIMLTMVTCANAAKNDDKTSPVNLTGVSNKTISGYTINLDGSKTVGIYLHNCDHIRITDCRIMNSENMGIRLDNCSDIIIENCFVSDVSVGIYAFRCTGGIKVNNNEVMDMVGPFVKDNKLIGLGAHIQFNSCTGGGNQINYNKCQTTIAEGNNPNERTGDNISLYKSSGIPGDPIQVYHNKIKGGGTSTGSFGAGGIIAGDSGGDWQDVEYNTVVDCGYAGIQQHGGSNNIIRHNTILLNNKPWSGAGLVVANYSGAPSANNTVSDNTVNCFAGKFNTQRDTVYKPGSGNSAMERPKGWETNVVKAKIDLRVLPDQLISPKNLLKRVKRSEKN